MDNVIPDFSNEKKENFIKKLEQEKVEIKKKKPLPDIYLPKENFNFFNYLTSLLFNLFYFIISLLGCTSKKQTPKVNPNLTPKDILKRQLEEAIQKGDDVKASQIAQNLAKLSK